MTVITIRPLLATRELDQAVALQKVYWGSVVPRHMLHSFCHFGGHVLGAFDGARLVGFVMGFMGRNSDSDTLIMSKRMLVLPKYRGQHIGLRLKLAQRQFAMSQDIPLITWTFDPLLAANARLNLRRLGAISRSYKVNYFDVEEPYSLTSDRLLVQWWLDSERARDCASGNISERTLQSALEDNPATFCAERSGEWMTPDEKPGPVSSRTALVEIPADMPDLESKAPALARRWRIHIRDVLSELTRSGFSACDLLIDGDGGQRRAFYYLGRASDTH